MVAAVSSVDPQRLRLGLSSDGARWKGVTTACVYSPPRCMPTAGEQIWYKFPGAAIG